MVQGAWALLASSWAVCSLLWPTNIIATPVTPPPPTTPAPALTFTHSMTSPGFVYALVYEHRRGEDVIARLRSQGGVFEDANPSDDASWGYDYIGEEERAWVAVTTNLEQLINQLIGHRGWRVLRIATSLHMIALPEQPSRVRFTSMVLPGTRWSDYFHGHFSHVVLGGIFMSQVQASASLDGRRHTDPITNLNWEDNPTWDPAWGGFGANGQQPLLSGRDLPQGVTARSRALLFMNELTSQTNTAISVEQLATLRRLLDWNPDREPDRDFPLIRTRESESLLARAMQAINWQFLSNFPNLPQHLQPRLALGLATLQECGVVYRAISKKDKRDENQYCDAEQPDDCTKHAKPDICESLVETAGKIQGSPNGQDSLSPSLERPPTKDSTECSEFNELTVHLELANTIARAWDDFDGAGTVDDIVIDIGHQTIVLAEAPSRGFKQTKTVDLEAAFRSTSGTVPVRDINRFKLYSKQDLQRNADAWKLEGILFKGRCAGSGRIAQATKWQSIERWYSRYGELYPYLGPTALKDSIDLDDWHWETEDDKTRTLVVSPPGQPGACAHFKAVNATLELGSSIWGAGTNHNIVIDFGHKGTSLAEGPSKGYSETRSLNLRKAFGSELVAVDAIGNFRLYGQVPQGQSEGSDEWELKSIILEGQCAESTKKAKLTKFHDLYTWQGRMNEDPGAFRGDMSLSDWQWVADKQ